MKSLIFRYTIAASALLITPLSIRATPTENGTSLSLRPQLVEQTTCASGGCDTPWPFVKCCSDKEWVMHTWCQGGGCGDSTCDGSDEYPTS